MDKCCKLSEMTYVSFCMLSHLVVCGVDSSWGTAQALSCIVCSRLRLVTPKPQSARRVFNSYVSSCIMQHGAVGLTPSLARRNPKGTILNPTWSSPACGVHSGPAQPSHPPAAHPWQTASDTNSTGLAKASASTTSKHRLYLVTSVELPRSSCYRGGSSAGACRARLRFCADSRGHRESLVFVAAKRPGPSCPRRSQCEGWLLTHLPSPWAFL